MKVREGRKKGERKALCCTFPLHYILCIGEVKVRLGKSRINGCDYRLGMGVEVISRIDVYLGCRTDLEIDGGREGDVQN